MLAKVLEPSEFDHICTKQQTQAVKELICKILELKEPETWPDVFLKSLEANYSHVVKALRDVYQTLEEDTFADVTVDIKEPSK